jgi:hypothetical protein
MKDDKKLTQLPMEIRVEKAMKQAAAKAIAENKRLGIPVAVWQDGKVIHMKPEASGVREPRAPYKISRKKIR